MRSSTHTLGLPISPFLRKTAGVDTSQLKISSFCLPTVMGDTLDVLRRHLVHRLHHTHTGGFLESGKRDTSQLHNLPGATPFITEKSGRATYSTNEKQGEKHIY
jgi:hypothetical protein